MAGPTITTSNSNLFYNIIYNNEMKNIIEISIKLIKKK